jgi:hypothetical protein
MIKKPDNGTKRTIAGKSCIYYDGYWIRHYVPPEDTLMARKHLILGLTRRTFHLTEPGINTPGEKLEMARAAYEAETDSARKRVKAAMLAGALFNRATDIFTKLVDLVSKGVQINTDNELMVQCGKYFQEALSLARNVRHYSGHEGIDELWGEPLKAFTMPIDRFYESRYIKIAQTMQDIDRIAHRLVKLCAGEAAFEGVEPLILGLATAARLECETMKSDPVIFDVWPRFVTAAEALENFRPKPPKDAQASRRAAEITELLKEGKKVVTYLAGARVPMRKSTDAFLQKCDAYERPGPQPHSQTRSPLNPVIIPG